MAERSAQHRLPPLLVIENVVGLLHGDNFNGLCEALSDLGMNVGAMVMNGRDFVAQSRQQVFVVAVDKSIELDGLVDSQPNGPWFTTAMQRAVADLPASVRKRWQWWRLPLPKGFPEPVVKLIDFDTVPDTVSLKSPEHTQRLLNMMTERNLGKVFAAHTVGGRHVGFLYRRTRAGIQRAEVRFDGAAPCTWSALPGTGAVASARRLRASKPWAQPAWRRGRYP